MISRRLFHLSLKTRKGVIPPNISILYKESQHSLTSNKEEEGDLSSKYNVATLVDLYKRMPKESSSVPYKPNGLWERYHLKFEDSSCGKRGIDQNMSDEKKIKEEKKKKRAE